MRLMVIQISPDNAFSSNNYTIQTSKLIEDPQYFNLELRIRYRPLKHLEHYIL